MSVKTSVDRMWPAVATAAVITAIAGFVAWRGAGGDVPAMPLITWTAAGLAVIAFACEFVDSSLGMGYGTLLTPVLAMFLGFDIKQVVPAVLFSELCTGLLSGICHHREGNVSLRPSGKPFKVALLLVSCSVVASFLAVWAFTVIPDWSVKLFVAVVVLSMGILILALRNRRFGFSWARIVGLGFLASFNKGMTGGGYGPLVMSGQVLSGVESKSAVGITALAEGLTCVVGVTTFAVVTGGQMPWHLAIPMSLGAVLSAPVAAWAVKMIPTRKFTLAIGAWTLVLGAISFVKIYPVAAKSIAALISR